MKLSIPNKRKNSVLAVLGLTLVILVAPISSITNEAFAKTHSNIKKQNKNNSPKSNIKTNDNRLPDGDYTQSCDGFQPDFDGVEACGPATDLGDE